MRRLTSLLLVALGAAMLLWTAALNGRPAVFTDTALYYSEGAYLFEALHLAQPPSAGDPAADPTRLPDTPGAKDISAAIDGARSPTYATFLYGLQRLGGLWLVAGVQALLAAAMAFALYRAAAPRARRAGYLLVMAALAASTPLSAFAAFAMPDVFSGVAASGVLLLALWGDRLSVAAKLAVAALTAFALSVHSSNLLDAAALFLLAAALLATLRAPERSVLERGAWIAGAGVAAVLAGGVLHAVIQTRAGEPIGSPPFLSARVIADGPGRTYLRESCARDARAWALCPYAKEPLATSDQILWSNRRINAVFVAASPAVRLAMERQDVRFALASTLADPWGQLRASASNALRQFRSLAVDDPLKRQDYYVREPYWRRTALPLIVPDASACASPTGCPARVGRRQMDILERVGLAAALVALAWRLSAPDVRRAVTRRLDFGSAPRAAAPLGDLERLAAFTVLVVALLVVNAMVCGVLSGPFSRYQARLVWLLPAAAGLVLAGAGVKRRETP